MVRHVVLGLLRNAESLHGYALVRAYRELTGSPLNSGNFYRGLQRLTAEGFVRAATRAADPDPRRMHYEITETGVDEFDAWFAVVTESGAAYGEDDLSLRTLFVTKVEPERARRLLDRWRDELWFRSQCWSESAKPPACGARPTRAGRFRAERASSAGGYATW